MSDLVREFVCLCGGGHTYEEIREDECDHFEDHPARRWMGLTSPETIEKAALAAYRFDYEADKSEVPNDEWGAHYRSMVEAVLRSVEEDETEGAEQ